MSSSSSSKATTPVILPTMAGLGRLTFDVENMTDGDAAASGLAALQARAKARPVPPPAAKLEVSSDASSVARPKVDAKARGNTWPPSQRGHRRNARQEASDLQNLIGPPPKMVNPESKSDAKAGPQKETQNPPSDEHVQNQECVERNATSRQSCACAQTEEVPTARRWESRSLANMDQRVQPAL